MFILAVAFDAITTPILTAAARLRRHVPPWECDHRWKVRPPAAAGTAARICSRCDVIEPLCGTLPPLHPESMRILLPVREETALKHLDDVLWPGEFL